MESNAAFSFRPSRLTAEERKSHFAKLGKVSAVTTQRVAARPRASRPSAPAKHLISPADQGRIQIEVTNFCGGHEHAGKCSNCSRFCPHIANPFFMDLKTFRRAIDSMRGYGGMVGIMGGEPTLHPQFSEIVGIFRQQWAGKHDQQKGRQPIADFAAYHAVQLARTGRERSGLWTSLGPGYAKHYELIQNTFGYQCINTHENSAVHQALLVTRREIGIPDDQWHELRKGCWVQRLWSSSITPKGCYPCEIMAALDLLYEVIPDDQRAAIGIPATGGWPIEANWWRRTPEEFGTMLAWCELCGAALSTPKRLAVEHGQDVSPWHLERLKLIDSPAIRRGQVIVVDPASCRDGPPEAKSADWYMPDRDKTKRAGSRNAHLSRKTIDGVVVSVDCAHQLAKTLPNNVGLFDRLVVVTSSRDTESQRIARECGAHLVVSDACYENGDAFNKGRMLNAGLEYLDAKDWVLLHDVDCFLPKAFAELRDLILNPGCLYFTKRHHLPPDVIAPDWSKVTHYDRLDPHGNNNPWGYFQLFNVRAGHIPKPFRLPSCFCSAGSIDHWTQSRWTMQQKISLADWAGNNRFDVLHLWHGGVAGRWNGVHGAEGWRYIGQANIGSGDKFWPPRWPVPCRVRRIDCVTLETDEIVWDGSTTEPNWPKKRPRMRVYEYSVRPL